MEKSGRGESMFQSMDGGVDIEEASLSKAMPCSQLWI